MSLESVKESTRSRKAAGVDQTYPKHTKSAIQIIQEKKVYKKPSKAELKRALALLQPCPELGKKIPNQPCGSPLHWCNHFGDKTAKSGECVGADRMCAACEFHPANQIPKNPLEGHFNPSIMEFDGKLVLASRHGWTGARIYITYLDKDLRPTSVPAVLDLGHPLSQTGQEDPRLFMFAGKPHIAFIGFNKTGTSQMVAELDENFNPVNIYAPTYDKRTYPLEKNWSFFTAPGGELCSVYSISPHVILCHRGTVAEKVCEVDWRPTWGRMGHLRGGAPPVKVGDEYWHFFHGMSWREGLKHKDYSIGLYTFDATFPFAPRRGPILLRTPPCDRANWTASVVFPCGAYLSESGKWLVSYGVNDESFKIESFSHNNLDDLLNQAPPNGQEPLPEEIEPAIAQADEKPGWCGSPKARSIADVIVREKLKTCVEIGVFSGQSLIPIAAAVKYTGGTVDAIDPWTKNDNMEGDHSSEEKNWWLTLDIEEIYRKAVSLVERFDVLKQVRIHRTTAQEIVSQFADASIDFLHIDGNHSELGSTRDVSLWLPKVRANGWIAFDDSHWQSVQKALSLLESRCRLVRDYGTWRMYRKA